MEGWDVGIGLTGKPSMTRDCLFSGCCTITMLYKQLGMKRTVGSCLNTCGYTVHWEG